MEKEPFFAFWRGGGRRGSVKGGRQSFQKWNRNGGTIFFEKIRWGTFLEGQYRGVVVITTIQLPLTKPELRFCASSNPSLNILEIYNGENLRQCTRLEIRFNVFCQSTLCTKQFIIIIIIIAIYITMWLIYVYLLKLVFHSLWVLIP